MWREDRGGEVGVEEKEKEEGRGEGRREGRMWMGGKIFRIYTPKVEVNLFAMELWLAGKGI